MLSLPDAYAVIMVAGQVVQTAIAKKTLSPVWNEYFEMCVLHHHPWAPLKKVPQHGPDLFGHHDTSYGQAEI
jgi:hypothetical protein